MPQVAHEKAPTGDSELKLLRAKRRDKLVKFVLLQGIGDLADKRSDEILHTFVLFVRGNRNKVNRAPRVGQMTLGNEKAG